MVGDEVFYVFGVDNYDVDVGLYVFAKLFLEATLDCLLVGGASIF